MRRVILVMSVTVLLAMVAVAQQENPPNANEARNEHRLTSNLHVGDWITFDSNERGMTIEVLPKSAELTIDAWYDELEKLIAAKRPFLEASQPISFRGSVSAEEYRTLKEQSEPKRKEALAKVNEFDIQIRKLGQRPYEVTAVYADHVAVRTTVNEYFLAADAVRYIRRPRK
jgi:hypothetical protein